jgi:hypothetical protein
MKVFNFYNPELKKAYLDTIKKESTRENTGSILQRVKPFEEEKGKDVCEFNFNEIAELWGFFRFPSIRMAFTIVSIISKYIDFCIDNGQSSINYNWAKSYFNLEGVKPFVSKVAIKKKVVTKEDLKNIMEFCVNAQDKAIFMGRFEGLGGRAKAENSLEELRNLKLSDCNTETNYVIARKDDGNTRLVKVSKETMDIFIEAYNQKTYLVNNGSSRAKKKELDLIDSEYILKSGDIGTEFNSEDSRVSAQLIRRRLKSIAKKYGNDFLTTSNILLSGMVDCAKQIKEKDGEIEKYDYEYICEKFGMNPKRWYNIKVEIENYL